MSLVGWWPLTEQAGQANDYSGNSNHGTVNGASRGAASPGGITGYSFSPSGGWVSTGVTSISAPFTLSFWAYPRQDANVGYYYGNFNATTEDIYCGNSSGGWRSVVDQAGTSNIEVSGSVDVNSWQHITITVDEYTHTLYKNGEILDSGVGASFTSNTGADLHIGGVGDERSDDMDGSISDFRLYDRALSPLEVKALHDNGMVGQPTDGIAKYAFEGDATDSWGGNDGTVNGATFTDGIRGQAASFDGTDDYIALPFAASNSPVTVATWVKTDGTTADSYETIAISYDGSGYGTQMNASTGNVRMGVWDGSSTLTATSSTDISDDAWHFVVGTWDGVDTSRIYVDGVLEQESTTSMGDTTSTNNFEIGRQPSVGSEHWLGLIDDVRVYPYALSSRQIQAIYRGWSDVVRPPEDGVAYYPLDGNATDQWGTNDGTVNGATPTTGLRGRAYRFDGIDDYITLPESVSVDNGDFSVCFWASIDSGNSNGTRLFHEYGSDTSNIIALARDQNNGDLNYTLRDTNDNIMTATGVPNLGEMYHYSLLKKGTTIYLYMNGSLVDKASNSSFGTMDLSGANNPTLGAETYNNIGYLDGVIDDVRIYDYALAPHEVHALYRWGMGGRDLRKTLVTR